MDTLGKMTDPYLRLFRGIIPPIIGFDLSPLLGFSLLTFLVDVFSSISFVKLVGQKPFITFFLLIKSYCQFIEEKP